MNAYELLYNNDEVDTSEFARRTSETSTSKSRTRQTFGRRRGKSPQQFNGMHRRRSKKIRW